MLGAINWRGEYFTYAYFQMLMKRERERERDRGESAEDEGKQEWMCNVSDILTYIT